MDKCLLQEPLQCRDAVETGYSSLTSQRLLRSSFFSQQLCPFWACLFSCCLFAVLGGGPPNHIRPPPKIMFESDAAYRGCIQSRFGYFVDDFDNWHPLFNKALSSETCGSQPALALMFPLRTLLRTRPLTPSVTIWSPLFLGLLEVLSTLSAMLVSTSSLRIFPSLWGFLYVNVTLTTLTVL